MSGPAFGPASPARVHLELVDAMSQESPAARMTGETFLSLVRQSGLLDAEVLKRHIKELQDAGTDLADTSALAEGLVRRNALTRWQADKILVGKHKGFFLGKYRLMSHLGKGGMSSVYLAEHVLMRRRVAIKVLPQARVEDSSYLQRFHREAQAVAALDHRNIVRAYDVDQEGSVHFLVMEYVPGQSLQELVSRKGVQSPVVAAEYIRQAAEGLAAAHKAGLVHRDIKPGNLLVDDRGTVKLLDLGLARFSTEESEAASLTIAHEEKVLGTADYLAPEQALDSHLVDTRADLYSLGGTLYFLLTGHPPFPEGTVTQRLLAHQTKEPVSLRIKRPDVPESFVAIVERLMKKKPDDRFQTAKEASAALFQWLAQNGGDAWVKMSNTATVSKSAASTSPTGESSGLRGAAGSSPAVGQPNSSVLPLAKEQDEPSGGSTAIRHQKGSKSAVVPKTATLDLNPVPPVGPSPAAEVSTTSAPQAAGDSTGFSDFSFLDKTAAPPAPDKSGSHPKVARKSNVSNTPPQASSTATVSDQTANRAAGEEPPTVDIAKVSAGPLPPASGPTSPGSPSKTAHPVSKPAAPKPIEPTPRAISATPASPPPIASEPVAPPIPSPEPVGGAFGFLQSPELAETAAFDLGSLSTPPAAASPEPKQSTSSPPAKPVAAVVPTVPPAGVKVAVANPTAKPAKVVSKSAAIPVSTALPASGLVPPAATVAPAGAASAPLLPDNSGFGFPGLPTSGSDLAGSAPEGMAFPAGLDLSAPLTPAVGVSAPTPPAEDSSTSVAVEKPARKGESAAGIPWKGISVGGIVAIALLSAYVFFTGSQPTTSGKKSRKPGSSAAEVTDGEGTGAPAGGTVGFKPTRELKVGTGQAFPDLAAALAEVKKEYGKFKADFDDSRRTGRLIRLTSGDGITQPIVIDGSLPNGLRIVADASLGVTLSSSASGPLLTIQGRERVQIEGLTLDANGKADGIRLTGQLSGLHLKHLSVNGFTKTGIVCEGALGYAGDREILLIDNVTLRSGSPEATGISLKKGDEPPAYVRIEKSTFSGPLQAGVVTNGALTEVEFRENVFSDAKTGIRIEGDGLRHRDLIFAYNSFHLGESGVRFTNMPASDSAGLGFYNNLFAGQSGPAVQIEKDFKVDDFLRMYSKNAGGAVNNWTDADKPAAPPAGVLMLFEAAGRWGVKDMAFQSTDPSSGNYLKPAPGSPQASVGRPGIKAYKGEQVGAKAP